MGIVVMGSAFANEYFGITPILPLRPNTCDQAPNADLPAPMVQSEFALAMMAEHVRQFRKNNEQTTSKDALHTPTSINNTEAEGNKTVPYISPLHPAGSALRRSMGPKVVSLEAFVSTRAIKAVPTPLSGITKIGTSCPQANDELR